MFYPSGVKSENGVAAVLRNYNAKRVTKVEFYSDRLVFVKKSVKSVDIVIVLLYMPTTDHKDDEIEKKMYDEICEILHQKQRSQVNSILMGDLNSIVGEGSTSKMVGAFGLCKRYENGKMLINCR